MFKIILAYILALLSMSVLAGFFSLFLLPLSFIGRRVRATGPVITFLCGAIPMFIALLIFVWICGKLEVQPTYAMFLLPFLLMLRNNFQRIDAAKKGYTRVAVMAGEGYDAGFQVKMEYGYLFGSLFGLVLFFFLINRLPLY